MSPVKYTLFSDVTCVPRVSGDEPARLQGELSSVKCSPRERG